MRIWFRITSVIAMSILSFNSAASEFVNATSSKLDARTVSSLKKTSLKKSITQAQRKWIVELEDASLLASIGDDISDYRKLANQFKHEEALNEPLTTTEHAINFYLESISAAQQNFLNAIDSMPSVEVHSILSKTLNGFVISASEEDALSLASSKGVKRVVKDAIVAKQLSNSVTMIGADDIWKRKDRTQRDITGQGITVAVIDTGVDFTHPDLGGCFGPGCKVSSGYDFVDGDDIPDDVDGHGTHVAGIIAANGTLRGVAPAANIMAVKALNNDGYGFTSDIIRAIEYAVDPDGDVTTDDGADVINLSLGGVGSPNDPMSAAVDAAVNAGIVVVAAAGNEGNYGDIANFSPASSRSAITVGSVDPDGSLSEFSSKGPAVGGDTLKPEVVAPGGSIQSLAVGGGTKVLSGTSMASPHVAGLAALILQARPEANAQEVKARLISSARDIGLNPFSQGYGLVHGPSAIDQTLLITSANLFLGRLDDSMSGVVIEKELTFQNTDTDKKNVSIEMPENLPTQVEVSTSKSSIELESGETQTVTIRTLLGDVASINYPQDRSGSYFDDIIFSTSEETLNIPLSFQRSLLLTITHDNPNYIDISVDSAGSELVAWNAVGPNRDEELFVAPGKYFITIDHELKNGDITREGLPSVEATGGYTILGVETYVVDIQENTTLHSSIDNLDRIIGAKGLESQGGSYANLHTVAYKLTHRLDEPGITYTLKNSANASVELGQTNTFFLFGNMNDEIDTTISVVDKLDAPDDQTDSIFHYWNTIDSETPGLLYPLNESTESALNIQADSVIKPAYMGYGVDVYLDDYNMTYDEEWMSLHIDSTSFDYVPIEGSETSEPVFFGLLKGEEDKHFRNQLIQRSPPLLFEAETNKQLHGYSARAQAVEGKYTFFPDAPLFSNAYELWDNNTIDNREPTFSSLTGSVMSGLNDTFELYCDGQLTVAGALSSGAVGDKGFQNCGETELIIENNYKAAGEDVVGTVTHIAQGGYFVLSGLYTLLVDRDNNTIKDTDIGVSDVYMLIGASKIAGTVSNLKVSLESKDGTESIALAVDSFNGGIYQYKVKVPSQLVERQVKSLRFEYESINSQSFQFLPHALTVGVDLTSTTEDFDGDGIANAHDDDNDNDGIPDIFERENNLNLLDASDASADTDNDGLTNLQEYKLGTNLNNPDTDGDGIFDGDDPTPLGYIRNDMDGDGKADILWRNANDGRNWMWKMDGLNIARSAGINVIYNQAWKIVGRGDFDGDGKSDVLWRNHETGRNYIYLMDGFTIKKQGELNYVYDSHWQIKEVLDLNGDGKDDIIWRHMSRGDTWIYLMDGIKAKSSTGSLAVNDLNWQIVASGDVNGDGYGDVIWRHKTRGTNYIWLMEGTSIKQRYVLNAVNTNWDIIGAGDLDADGIDDILWRNKVDGRNWAYLMENGQIRTSELINIVENANWEVADIVDLNGDGKSDIFWRQTQSGQSYMYLMNGIGIAGRAYGDNVGSQWQVIH